MTYDEILERMTGEDLQAAGRALPTRPLMSYTIDEFRRYMATLRASSAMIHDVHPWLDNLKKMIQVMHGELKLPHETGWCDECDRVRTLRAASWAEKRRQSVSAGKIVTRTS